MFSLNQNRIESVNERRGFIGGYSLVEVLIAISILLISIIGPFTIASTGLKNASFSKQQNTAFFLAQEGLEAVIKIREDNALPRFVQGNDSLSVWDQVTALSSLNCTDANPCGVDASNSTVFDCDNTTCDLYLFDTGRLRYRHNTSGTATEYRREITIDVNPTRVRINSTVTWGSQTDQKVEMETYAYNIYENQ